MKEELITNANTQNLEKIIESANAISKHANNDDRIKHLAQLVAMSKGIQINTLEKKNYFMKMIKELADITGSLQGKSSPEKIKQIQQLIAIAASFPGDSKFNILVNKVSEDGEEVLQLSVKSNS